MKQLTRSLATLLACGAAWLASPAVAQSPDAYPTKPVRIVLPFPPGGSVDIVMRLLGPGLSERLGQPVVIENKPGAGGNIAIDSVAKAAPDGYTIGVGAGGALGLNGLTGQRMSYDPQKDLTPIGRIVSTPFVLVTSPNQKWTNVEELIAAAKRNPKEVTIGHGGVGTLMQLTGELFRSMAGIDAVLVPYKGTGPATSDAAGGQVALAISDPPTAVSMAKAGRLRALAVTSATRSQALPEVPTLAEQGLRGYEAVGWFGMVAPAGTPPAIVRRLNTELNAVLNDPAVREKLVAYGADATPSTPGELQALMRTDTAKWGEVIKRAGLKFD